MLSRRASVERLEQRELLAFGQVDTLWGTAGRTITSMAQADATVRDIDVFNGKIYAAGNSFTANESTLIRYTAAGAIDTTFGTNGKVTFPTGGLVKQLVTSAGIFLLFGGDDGTKVMKLKFDGSLDPSFGVGGTAIVTLEPLETFRASTFADAGGKLVVSGEYSTSSDLINFNVQVFRLRGNGMLDARFGKHGSVVMQLGLASKRTPYVVDLLGSIKSLSDGRILMAGGSMAWYPDQPDPSFDQTLYGNAYVWAARLTASGGLDGTYAGHGISRVEIPAGQMIARSVDTELKFAFPERTHFEAVFRDDGSAVVAGRAFRLSVASFDANGAVLYNKNAGSGFQLDIPSDMVLLPDGRAVLSGFPNRLYRGHGPALAEVFADGTIGPYALTDDLNPATTELLNDDPIRFDPYAQPHPLALAPDGQLLVGGATQSGTGFELEKLRIGSASDPRPDYFAGATVNDLVRDDSGALHLAYYDSVHHDLKYAHRAVNGQWSAPVTVDATPFAGANLSIGIDSKNQPAIAYYDGTHRALRFARSTDSGATWTIQTVDSHGNTGLFPSLVIDAAGATDQVMIAYYRKTSGDLKFATRNLPGSWHFESIDTAGDVGRSVRLFKTIPDITPQPVVAYADMTHHAAKFATRQTDGRWKTETITTTEGAEADFFIAYGRYNPTISFYDAAPADLKVAINQGQWEVDTVASKGAVGLFSSVTYFDPNDPSVGVQAYAYDKTHDTVSLYLGATSGGPETVPLINGGGDHFSLARNSLGRLAEGDAAYLDSSTGMLHVGTVFNPFDDHTDLPQIGE